MSTINVLITGANRGIGRALLQTYLSRPNHTVIGSVRDVAAASSKGLEDIPAAAGSKLILVKIESACFTDPVQAVSELKSQGIAKLDLVIANAAISGKAVLPAVDGDAEDFANILAVNTVGPLALFAAASSLLDHAEEPKWVSISSSVASSANHEASFVYLGSRPMGFGYGASKAALNHLTVNIHLENPNLTVIALDPGFLDTDMGNAGAKAFGLEKPPHNVGDNVKAIVKLVDIATRATHSGKFLDFEGREVPW